MVSLVVFWASMGFNQYVVLADPEATRRELWTGEIGMQILTANTWMIPWFAVIAGYPVLVPRTRSAGPPPSSG